MPANPGTQPGATRGKRVRVRLHNGIDSERYDPPHWPADSLRWDIRNPPHPGDIKFWSLIE
jgi:hypothetical protein